MSMQAVQHFLANYGGYMVLGVAAIAIGATAAALGVFLFTHLIGESKGGEHGHAASSQHH
ncbi:MAG: hypothetical protein IT454_16330 [Planctomycetes bacterium]|nr:hypothetical protein [Planctomycetota bacterium]